jgi:hypothetical protein
MSREMTVEELAAMLEERPLPADATALQKLRAITRDVRVQPLYDHEFVSGRGERYTSKVVDAGILIDLLFAAEALVTELWQTPPPRS